MEVNLLTSCKHKGHKCKKITQQKKKVKLHTPNNTSVLISCTALGKKLLLRHSVVHLVSSAGGVMMKSCCAGWRGSSVWRKNNAIKCRSEYYLCRLWRQKEERILIPVNWECTQPYKIYREQELILQKLLYVRTFFCLSLLLLLSLFCNCLPISHPVSVAGGKMVMTVMTRLLCIEGLQVVEFEECILLTLWCLRSPLSYIMLFLQCVLTTNI